MHLKVELEEVGLGRGVEVVVDAVVHGVEVVGEILALPSLSLRIFSILPLRMTLSCVVSFRLTLPLIWLNL